MKKRRLFWVQRERPAARAESGQALIWVAVMLPLFLSIVGLAIDSGLVFAARRELQNVADAAARAGAMQIDERVYRERSGVNVALDPPAAYGAAGEYLTNQGIELAAEVNASPEQVTVRVSREVPTSLLQLVGIERVRIAAEAVASVRYGIDRGNGNGR